MRFPINTWALHLSVLLLSGCAAHQSTQPAAAPFDNADSAISQFCLKHPAEAKQYTSIHPTTTEMAETLLTIESTVFLDELKGLKNRFPNDAKVNSYADQAIGRTNASVLGLFQFMNGFKTAIADGGVICDYDWSDGKTHEFGLLVIKSGEVTRREPWITVILPAKGNSN